MGKRLQARAIEKTMAKAFNLGIAEDTFEILGVQITIQTLSEPQWMEVIERSRKRDEEEDLYPDLALKATQIDFLARSVVEIDGVSFRGVSSVELDADDESGKPVVIEKEEYLIHHVFNTWLSEVLDAVNVKFFDLIRTVETRAKSGLVFHTPQDTPEEKFRELLLEAKDLRGQIPFDLSEKILADTGFKEIKLQKSSFEEEIEREVPPSEPSAPASPPIAPKPVDMQTRVPLTRQPSLVVPDLATSPVAPTNPIGNSNLTAPQLPPIPEMNQKQRELADLENEVLKQPPVVYEEALAPPSRGGINPRFRPVR